MKHKRGTWVVTFCVEGKKFPVLKRRFFFRFTAYYFALRRYCNGWKVISVEKGREK